MFAARKSEKFIRAVLSLAITLIVTSVIARPQTSAQAATYTLTTCNASEFLTAVNNSIANSANDFIYLLSGCTYTFTDDFGETGRAFPTIPAYTTAGALNIYGNGATVTASVAMSAYSMAAGSYLNLNDTIFVNFAGSLGAIVYTGGSGASLNMNNIRASGNYANSAGGVIYCTGGATCIVYDSYFNQNIATIGGAIYGAFGSTVAIFRSRLSDNIGGFVGGALYVNADSTIEIYDSTLAFNSAGVDGGAVYCDACDLIMSNNTLHDNDADADNNGTGDGGALALSGSFTTLPRIHNTVFHANEDLNGASATIRSDISGTVDTASFNNFISVNTGLNGVTNMINGNRVGFSSVPLDPLLGAYKVRPGGLFGTRAPLPNSPLINAGSNTYTFGFRDHRGTHRILYTTVDIGAVEFKRPDSPVVINPANQGWLFRNYNAAGPVDFSFLYGQGLTDYNAVTGDWNGDDIDTQGVYTRFNASNIGVFALSNDFNSFDAATLPAFVFSDASPDWLPVDGDWDGNGADSVGAYNISTSVWVLTNNNSSTTPTYPAFAFGGGPGVVPVRGDWDGNGVDSIGMFNFNTSRWILSNGIVSEAAVNYNFVYGAAGSYPVVGDWDGDGIDTVGLYNPTTGQWLLRNSNDTGSADIAFVYGSGTGLIGRTGQWKTVLPGNGTSPIRELAATPVVPDAPQIAPTFAP